MPIDNAPCDASVNDFLSHTHTLIHSHSHYILTLLIHSCTPALIHSYTHTLITLIHSYTNRKGIS